jgi:GNAT superfamily N-acetyltransferase
MRAKRKKPFLIIGYALSFLYRRQVEFTFPIDTLARFRGHDWSLPEGYSLSSPHGGSDLSAWAELLNSDGGFGVWDGERIRSDILRHLITPDAASLLFYRDELIGCFCTYDHSSRGHKTGFGMWFIVAANHRGKGLSYALCFRTLYYFAREGYEKVVLSTDPFRLPALKFYLSHGAEPVYHSLFSYVQWRRIRRRIRDFNGNRFALKGGGMRRAGAGGDFNPSERMEGVRAFKMNFGAKPLPSPIVFRKTPAIRLFVLMKKVFGGKGRGSGP